MPPPAPGRTQCRRPHQNRFSDGREHFCTSFCAHTHRQTDKANLHCTCTVCSLATLRGASRRSARYAALTRCLVAQRAQRVVQNRLLDAKECSNDATTSLSVPAWAQCSTSSFWTRENAQRMLGPCFLNVLSNLEQIEKNIFLTQNGPFWDLWGSLTLIFDRKYRYLARGPMETFDQLDEADFWGRFEENRKKKFSDLILWPKSENFWRTPPCWSKNFFLLQMT